MYVFIYVNMTVNVCMNVCMFVVGIYNCKSMYV